MTKDLEKQEKKVRKTEGQIEAIVKVAQRLFEKKGYEQVGMREISAAANKSPMQLYRLGLDKQDLLAEVIIRVNAQQIKHIQAFSQTQKQTATQFIEAYLLDLYKQDITIKSIRKEGAAFGWKWSEKYETLIIEQLMQIIQPISDALLHEKFDGIQARCFGIWSLYYVGYRNAVMNNGNAQSCLEAIKPSLSLLLRK
ncbi:TetR/AcrR family transcriptional regulator [Polynucleobacter sp. 71A-WALBACH]|uniref:TetR/AcrR family transcriptional regulator n=1 Tax=Polynucleobacter sp. 71A-WALBACH TaxID=2689097 RepID=UPI001C0C6E8E|nr:TetR/AcrR family transcriptional regulator [Polynucleobacter sp. 71A-WALBACH]MBU3594216.1 TetR/AcrR family transcriptional regulator [Polynucleobacter sp. 71A-WALBACH]